MVCYLLQTLPERQGLKVLFLRFADTWQRCQHLLQQYPSCMIGLVADIFEARVGRKIPSDRFLISSFSGSVVARGEGVVRLTIAAIDAAGNRSEAHREVLLEEL